MSRNQLAETVKEVRLGAIMVEVIIQVGDNQLVSAITKDTVEDLALKASDKVTALVKSTSVMILK